MATDLKDIRETVKADRDAWFETQQEANTDMLCVSGKVWEAMDPEGLRIRQDRKRPALNLDELGQFTNQLINEVRANKRAIRVTPIGYGANDKTATYRQDRIRQIEYRSNAQSAYTTMFENAVQRSYGYLRITAQYVNDRPNPDKLTAADFEQELLIKPIVNPNTVIPDAAGVMSDGSTMPTRLPFSSKTACMVTLPSPSPSALATCWTIASGRARPRSLPGGWP